MVVVPNRVASGGDGDRFGGDYRQVGRCICSHTMPTSLHPFKPSATIYTFPPHLHTHTHMYIHIYVCICVCVLLCIQTSVMIACYNHHLHHYRCRHHHHHHINTHTHTNSALPPAITTTATTIATTTATIITTTPPPACQHHLLSPPHSITTACHRHQVKDCASSKRPAVYRKGGRHSFGYRDFMDTVVRWRQIRSVQLT